MVLALIVFVGLLLLLVLAHELGHFLVAKWAGCRVEEFGFGFPPRLFSIKRGETTYSFNALPIGGFVKIEGEDMEEANPTTTSFASKSAWRRIAILCAGVFMNVIVAIILLSIQAGIGSPTVVTEANEKSLTDFRTYIVQVAPNTPAADAGIKELDRIVRIDEVMNPTLTQAQQYIVGHAGSQINIEVERTGQHLNFKATPRQNPPAGQGALGISLAETGLVKVPWWQAPWAGLQRTWQLFTTMLQQLGIVLAQLFHSHTVSSALTGPIGIAVYTNEATKMGFSYVLEFGALISLNLAVINILPLPALDGGRILFVAIELVRRGKRVPQKYEQWTHTIGFAVLIALMVLISLKDIAHYL